MAEFESLKAGCSQDSSVLQFFSSIDEGLKAFNDNVNLLSNGAQFYKQMHQYLSSLLVFVNDFVQSRTMEKNELTNQLNQGGAAMPQPQAQAPGTAYLGQAYQPPRYQ